MTNHVNNFQMLRDFTMTEKKAEKVITKETTKETPRAEVKEEARRRPRLVFQIDGKALGL